MTCIEEWITCEMSADHNRQSNHNRRDHASRIVFVERWTWPNDRFRTEMLRFPLTINRRIRDNGYRLLEEFCDVARAVLGQRRQGAIIALRTNRTRPLGSH